MARGPRLRKWRGPRSMAWLVARRELPPSLFSFLHGRTWSAPCFITFLTLLVSSPPRRSIPSLLIQTRAQHLGDTLAYFSSGCERLPCEVAPSRGIHPCEASNPLARHSSSRSVKSSGGVHYLLARSICPLEVVSGTCLERHPPEAFSLQAYALKGL